MSPPPPVRRFALTAGLLAVALISCGREITGPGSAPLNAFKRVAAFAFSPQYETAVRGSALQAALLQVAFERVRITLRREDGSIALDTVVDFPAGADSLTLSLIVPLPASAPASGVPLSLNLGYVNAAGDTVFRGGPLPVTVLPSAAGSAPPPPVQIPVHYTGTGSNATSVVIAPKTAGGIAGQSTTFSAQALGAGGLVIAGTPVVFSSSNPGVVTIPNPSSGAATFVGRGTAKVYAQLLTGPIDSAVVTVTLPASALSLVSGGGQTAPAGTTLPLPVVARVAASDGIGVGGVTVTFAVASGSGTVTPASAVSAADGQVSTTWKLGPTAGEQSLTLASAGLGGSPLTAGATAQPVIASKLVMTTEPVSGKTGTALPAVAVTAQDALGNTVTTFTGDVSVSLKNNPGSAILSGTTTVKAVDGVATFSNLSLNRPGTGYTLLFSSSNLSSVGSTPFDVTTGDAARLVFSQVTSTADAGITMGSVQVSAQDASGNTVTSFTGGVTVAIGNNPGASTLSGTLTRTAVAGVATFNDLSLNKKGAGYTLTASATGLTIGTSAPFNVAPGAPIGLSLVSGGGQSAAAGSVLNPISVLLRDALGNGIEGASIAFAVTGGGGTLSAATALTDASGTASVSWTIGSGAQTMTATFTGLPSLTITSTSTTAVLNWTGATSSDWNTASNWSPAFVPASVDAITIPVTSTAPVITAPVTIGSLVVAAGATLTNNSILTVNGSVDAGTTITGSGGIILAGASGTLKGVINQAVAVSGGAYTLAGATQVSDSMKIDATGKLTMGGQSLTVTGNLGTFGSGRLAMTNAADLVTVTGTMTFAGGSESGFLTAGRLSVLGNFDATGATFSASGSHLLELVGAITPQTLDFTSPVAGQGINHLNFENGAAKTMSGAPQIMGDVTIEVTSAPVGGLATVRIGGNFSDATIFPDSGGYPNPLGGWRVANTNFFGTNKIINSVFITSNVTVSGTVKLAPCTSCLVASLYASLLATDGYVQVNGDVTASGAGAILKLNGNQLEVAGNFATANGGAVDLTDPNDYLHVLGSAVFGGGSTAGKLTYGTLEVVQDFTQSGAADSFAPGVNFSTYIGEPYAAVALRASRSRALRSPTGAEPAMEATTRSARAQRLAPLRAERAERHARLDRRAAAYAARGMAAPSRERTAMQGRTVESAVLRRSSPRRVYTGTSNITFANPTSSFFGELYLAGPTFYLGSDITVIGELETGMSSNHNVYSSSASPRKITSHGADVSDLAFDNVSWILLDGSNVWGMDYVEFSNMDPTVDQFTVARTSDELADCDCNSYYELYNWVFYTTPTTGHYIRVTDTNGPPNVTSVRMTYPYPATHGGRVAASPGPVTDMILNWPETSVTTWTGAVSTAWSDPANWTTSTVPTASDDVSIPSGLVMYPKFVYGSPNAYMHNLTIESGVTIDPGCYGALHVYGNVVAPVAADAMPGSSCEGMGLYLRGDGGSFNTVVGNFSVVYVEGNYQLPGTGTQLIANRELKVDGGNLTINGGRVDVGGVGGTGIGTFYTFNGGTLTMTNPADQMFVGSYGANFYGGSTTGLLTAGTLTLVSGYLYTSSGAAPDAFAPSGTHLTVFDGSSIISFFDPAQSFLRNAQLLGGASIVLESNALVTGTLSRGTGSGPTSVGGYVYPYPSQMLTVNGLNQSGADPMQFANVTLKLTGGSGVTFGNVKFSGFDPAFSGSLFEITRSGGPYTFSGLDFSLAGFSPDTSKHFINNSGSANITVSGSSPTSGTNGTHYILTSTGTVSWP